MAAGNLFAFNGTTIFHGMTLANWIWLVKVGDLIKLTDNRMLKLSNHDSGLGLIVSVSDSGKLCKARFFKGKWAGKIKPIAKIWLEVIDESR